MIPYGRQSISQADIDAVVEVLRSDFLTQGPKVPEFETAVAAVCKAKHAVAVNSATSALHIACLALEVGPGDIVWTSPITFVASANCALYCGASVDFVDVEPETGNLCVVALEAKLKKAKAENKLPKVVIPVHLAGLSCEMEAIYALSKTYGFKIIEDASHAIGGTYQQASVGNCRFSEITILSFHPVKIITTAEGGMALTNSKELARKMELLRSHGISRDENEMTQASHGDWYYQQLLLGFNYRLTELQAALGLSQLARLESFVAARQQLAERYDSLLAGLPLEVPARKSFATSALHLYTVKLHNKEKRAAVFKTLRDAGIGANVHYIPVHSQPYYQTLGFKNGDFPVAEDFYQRIISLPLFPDLKSEQQEFIVATLKQALL